jgi:hypothetical protein
VVDTDEGLSQPFDFGVNPVKHVDLFDERARIGSSRWSRSATPARFAALAIEHLNVAGMSASARGSLSKKC